MSKMPRGHRVDANGDARTKRPAQQAKIPPGSHVQPPPARVTQHRVADSGRIRGHVTRLQRVALLVEACLGEEFVCSVVEITGGGDGAVGADPGLQIGYGGDAARGLHRGRQVHGSVCGGEGGVQVAADQGSASQPGLAPRGTRDSVLAGCGGDRTTGEPCCLHRAAEIDEGVRPHAIEGCRIDEPRPLRLGLGIDALESTYSPASTGCASTTSRNRCRYDRL